MSRTNNKQGTNNKQTRTVTNAELEKANRGSSKRIQAIKFRKCVLITRQQAPHAECKCRRGHRLVLARNGMEWPSWSCSNWLPEEGGRGSLAITLCICEKKLGKNFFWYENKTRLDFVRLQCRLAKENPMQEASAEVCESCLTLQFNQLINCLLSFNFIYRSTNTNLLP